MNQLMKLFTGGFFAQIGAAVALAAACTELTEGHMVPAVMFLLVAIASYLASTLLEEPPQKAHRAAPVTTGTPWWQVIIDVLNLLGDVAIGALRVIVWVLRGVVEVIRNLLVPITKELGIALRDFYRASPKEFVVTALFTLFILLIFFGKGVMTYHFAGTVLALAVWQLLGVLDWQKPVKEFLWAHKLVAVFAVIVCLFLVSIFHRWSHGVTLMFFLLGVMFLFFMLPKDIKLATLTSKLFWWVVLFLIPLIYVIVQVYFGTARNTEGFHVIVAWVFFGALYTFVAILRFFKK